MSPCGSGAEWRKVQKEHNLILKKDQASSGLFGGMFDRKKRFAIADAEDDVARCAACAWEIHGTRCENPACGMRYRRTVEGLVATSESESSSEDDSEMEMHDDRPEAWPESVIGETTADEDTEVDDDGWEDEDQFEEEDDEGPISNRARHIRATGHDDTDDAESESDDDTEGSLNEFVIADTPHTHSRRHRDNEPNPWSSPPSSSPVEVMQQHRRPNARRRILDEDDEDDDAEESSVSEASPRAPNRGFRMGSNPRDHVNMSSDYDDEQSHLLSDGYETLRGGMTTGESENDDDGSVTPPIQYLGSRSRVFSGAGSLMHSPGVLTVPEEAEEEDYGDADESEDPDGDGDIRMSEPPTRGGRTGSNRSAQTYRRGGSDSRAQSIIDLDSASESEAAVSTRRRTRRPANSVVPRPGNYFGNQRSTGGSSRSNNAGVDPRIASLYQFHTEQLAEQQYNSLGARTSSTSPARSVTPVQRDINRSRQGTPLSISSSVPPFSPLQQPQSASGSRQQTPSAGSAQSSRQQTPNANPPAGTNHSAQSSRASTMSPRATANTTWNVPSHMISPVQRIASPVVRVRSRTSRPILRGSASRAGLRPNVTSPTSSGSTFIGGTSIAGTQGRQSNTGGASNATRAYLTSEDIRQMGIQRRQQLLQQQQEQSGRTSNGQQTSQRQAPGNRPSLPNNVVNLISSPASPGQTTDQGVAWIGGESSDGRSGGPGVRYSTRNRGV